METFCVSTLAKARTVHHHKTPKASGERRMVAFRFTWFPNLILHLNPFLKSSCQVAPHSLIRISVGDPGWVAQLVRASSQHTKAAGLIPVQGTHKTQLMNASIIRATS